MKVQYPNVMVKLVGEDGNAFSILGRVAMAMNRAGLPRSEINAFQARTLPPTTGFFFGRSAETPEEIAAEMADDIVQIERAIAWVETKEDKVARDVIYHASW